MFYKEIIAVCSQIHTQHTNTQCGPNVFYHIKTYYISETVQCLWQVTGQ
jgi:hypothetical protein